MRGYLHMFADTKDVWSSEDVWKSTKKGIRKGEKRSCDSTSPPPFPLVELGACPISGGAPQHVPCYSSSSSLFPRNAAGWCKGRRNICGAVESEWLSRGFTRKKKGNVHSCCRRKMSKNVKCFLFWEAVFFSYFCVRFPLKKSQKINSRHANHRDRTKEKKCMHYWMKRRRENKRYFYGAGGGGGGNQTK